VLRIWPNILIADPSRDPPVPADGVSSVGFLYERTPHGASLVCRFFVRADPSRDPPVPADGVLYVGFL